MTVSHYKSDRLAHRRDCIPNAKMTLSPLAQLWSDRQWIAVSSSHLGTNAALQAEVSRYLSRSVLECRKSESVVMVAADSAAEELARRAAELFDVPLLLVIADSEKTELPPDTQRCASVLVQSASVELQRDNTLIQLADRVDALSIRPSGRIEKAIVKRLTDRPDTSTRIAILKTNQSTKQKRAIAELMRLGAVGWYLRQQATDDPSKSQPPVCGGEDRFSENDWMKAEGEWLVHCTRTPNGPMPGQTLRQHQDAMLLVDQNGDSTIANSPMVALESIIRSRYLIANAIASAHQYPVVCFSEVPLATLLENRRYRPHLKRWDYEPFGIAIRKNAAMRQGIQPVIYGQAKDRNQISAADQFRFQAKGKTYDWTREREWRSRDSLDLNAFDNSDIRVFVPGTTDAQRIERLSPWEITVVNDLVCQ